MDVREAERFGICLNDAGYGAILALLGAWMLSKNRKPGMMRQAAWFATLCGVSTILFGLLCGSFFGISMSEWFPSIHFFDFQGQFFSIALAIGLVQIMFGMVLKIVMISSTVGFRYSLGSLGWLLVILGGSLAAGLPMLNSGWVIPFSTTSSPAFYGDALGGCAVLMLFFNSPGKNPLLNFGLGLWVPIITLRVSSPTCCHISVCSPSASGGILATVFNALAAGFVPEGSGIICGC